MKAIYNYNDTHTYIHSYICIQVYMHTVHKTWYINTIAYTAVHTNPYETQNRSPAHKAMKTFNSNK